MTGGQGADDEVLGSAEFFDLSTQQWTMVIIVILRFTIEEVKSESDKNIQVSSLKVARTEHVMSLIYGVPTIIGWLHHTIYHYHHIHYYQHHIHHHHHLSDNDHQAE